VIQFVAQVRPPSPEKALLEPRRGVIDEPLANPDRLPADVVTLEVPRPPSSRPTTGSSNTPGARVRGTSPSIRRKIVTWSAPCHTARDTALQPPL
jgi:hypothetical protein